MGFQDFHAAAAAQGRRTLGWLALFGIAMGYFEAAVVVDLRAGSVSRAAITMNG